ncbi:MAG: DUF3793 family protein [Oscillospiraceae bacterium]|nr:DUF3793 family protein [Oscillospiraceae bacterium]
MYEIHETVETTLARHCAPVLLGRKPASLFGKPEWWDCEAMDKQSIGNVRLCVLHMPVKRPLIFAYQPKLLSDMLKISAVRNTLRSMGYSGTDLDTLLRQLKQKFLVSSVFPHEVGLFLGYPPEDVVAFIQHKGQHCKLCGMWKVYHNAENAARLFAEYKRCDYALARHIKNGGTIYDSNLTALLAG